MIIYSQSTLFFLLLAHLNLSFCKKFNRKSTFVNFWAVGYLLMSSTYLFFVDLICVIGRLWEILPILVSCVLRTRRRSARGWWPDRLLWVGTGTTTCSLRLRSSPYSTGLYSSWCIKFENGKKKSNEFASLTNNQWSIYTSSTILLFPERTLK